MYSKVFARNVQPVIDGLSPFIGKTSGRALEIGSGSGQHVISFASAFPDLVWTPSDPDPLHRRSIDAWRRHKGAGTRAAIALDGAGDWPLAPEIAALAPLHLILSMNVIHISPIKTLEGIIRGAGAVLAPDGRLVFYGPFMENNRHTGEGNALFDARLRADNPDWGVRDVATVTALGADCGIVKEALVEMPSNNRLLVMKRA